jgi:hypothetical protein
MYARAGAAEAAAAAVGAPPVTLEALPPEELAKAETASSVLAGRRLLCRSSSKFRRGGGVGCWLRSTHQKRGLH